MLWNPVRLEEHELFEVTDLLHPFSVNFIMDNVNVSRATILTVPLGANLLVQAGLGAAGAIFIVCVVLGPWLALIIFCAAMIDRHVHPTGAFTEVAMAIATIALLFFVRTFDKVSVYLGGIWRYVGARSAMASVEAELIRLLDETATQAPRASVILLGYGLGGALAADALLRVAPTNSTRNRLSFMTVGTPLALLARWFPKRFPTAQNLALQYASAGTVNAWFNLWRDRDFIAGPLRVENLSVIDTSIGDGLHRDTFNSAELWTHVRDIASALENNSLPALQIAWAEAALTEAELSDLARLERHVFVTMGYRFTTYALIWNVAILVSTFFIRCPIGTRWLIGFVISAIIFLWLGIAYTFAHNSLPRILQRERLRNLRLAATLVLYVRYLIEALTAIGISSVAWGAASSM